MDVRLSSYMRYLPLKECYADKSRRRYRTSPKTCELFKQAKRRRELLQARKLTDCAIESYHRASTWQTEGMNFSQKTCNPPYSIAPEAIDMQIDQSDCTLAPKHATFSKNIFVQHHPSYYGMQCAK